MKIHDTGLALIKEFEGLRLTAYDDGFGTLTIGYGHTGDVAPGQRIGEAEAEALLRDDIEDTERAVSAAVIGANPNQFAAMVSLAFNIGAGAFRTSTVLRRHNAGDAAGAARAFLLWNKAGGRVVPGLVRRRTAEMELYLRPVAVSRPPDVTAPEPRMPQTVDPEPRPPTPAHNLEPQGLIGAGSSLIAIIGSQAERLPAWALVAGLALGAAVIGLGILWWMRRGASRSYEAAT